MKSLIVPLDESDLSERALPVAAALAARTGAEILLLLVNSPGVTPGEDRWYLERLSGALPAGVRRRELVDLVDEDVDRVIVQEAAAAPDAVIVMATHGRTALGDLVLGSTAAGVVRRSPVPVVLVGPSCEQRDDGFAAPLVAGVEGTRLDETVLDAAGAWARAADTVIEVVHVRVPTAIDGGIVLSGGDDLALEAASTLRHRGVDAHAHTFDAAKPTAGLLEAVDELGAGAVLLGSTRPGRVERGLLGSTAMGVTHRAPVPVIVVGSTLGDEP